MFACPIVRHTIGFFNVRLIWRLATVTFFFFTPPGTDDFLFWHDLLLLRGLLAHPDRLARSSTGAGVRPRALTANWQAAAMPQSPVGADLHQALDIQRDLAAQLTFDLRFLVDHVPQPADLIAVAVLAPDIGIDVRDRQHAPGGLRPDPEDVGQRHFDPFLSRNINAGDTRHLSS